MSNKPTKFDASQFRSRHAHDEYGDPILDENGKPKPSIEDIEMERLQAFLSCIKLDFKVREVCEELVNMNSPRGPQLRVKGSIMGDGIKFGSFDIAFKGRAINITLEGKRQELFSEALENLNRPQIEQGKK